MNYSNIDQRLSGPGIIPAERVKELRKLEQRVHDARKSNKGIKRRIFVLK